MYFDQTLYLEALQCSNKNEIMFWAGEVCCMMANLHSFRSSMRIFITSLLSWAGSEACPTASGDGRDIRFCLNSLMLPDICLLLLMTLSRTKSWLSVSCSRAMSSLSTLGGSFLRSSSVIVDPKWCSCSLLGVCALLRDRKLDHESVSKLSSEFRRFRELLLMRLSLLMSPPRDAKIVTFVSDRKLFSKCSGTKYCSTLKRLQRVILSVAAGV